MPLVACFFLYCWPSVGAVANPSRLLVKEGFPLHDDHIAALLESIGDHEQDIIETVMFAVANARYLSFFFEPMQRTPFLFLVEEGNGMRGTFAYEFGTSGTSGTYIWHI